MRHDRSIAALAALWFVGHAGCADLLDIPSGRHLETSDAALPVSGECATSADCQARGPSFVCRGAPASARCVSLLSPHCDVVDGDYGNPNAIFVGVLAPTKGPNSSTGLGIQNSVLLAANEIRNTSNGLPPAPGGSDRRPLVIVGCNDAEDAIGAARHLVDVVGTPAIIGAAFSTVTIRVATDVTIPKGVALISPSATSTAITAQEDQGLLWRTAPSDDLQSAALVEFFPLLEADVRAKAAIPAGAPIRVAVVHKGDAYGSGLALALDKRLTFNGKAALDPANQDSYLTINYGDPEETHAAEWVAGTVVDRLIAFKPHVVFALGTVEAVQGALLPSEQRWPAELPRPRWLLADGGMIPELRTGVGDDEELRRRVMGSVPGTTGPAFRQFRSRYSAVFPDVTLSSPDTFGTAAGYDALYVLAYAIATQPTPLTGASIVAGIGQLVPPGPLVEVGPDAINATFSALRAGSQIDLAGASGPLDFDLRVGEAPSDIQIWCLPKDQTVQSTAMPTGLYLDPSSQLRGAFDADVCGFSLARPPGT